MQTLSETSDISSDLSAGTTPQGLSILDKPASSLDDVLLTDSFALSQGYEHVWPETSLKSVSFKASPVLPDCGCNVINQPGCEVYSLSLARIWSKGPGHKYPCFSAERSGKWNNAAQPMNFQRSQVRVKLLPHLPPLSYIFSHWTLWIDILVTFGDLQTWTILFQQIGDSSNPLISKPWQQSLLGTLGSAVWIQEREIYFKLKCWRRVWLMSSWNSGLTWDICE